MPHIFSVEIHEYLSAKIEQAEGSVKQAVEDNATVQQRRFKGELFELMIIRQYLTDNFDLKTQKYY